MIINNIKYIYYYNTMDNNKRVEFQTDVQKWVAIDSQLKLANDKIRQLRESKSQLTSKICNFIDTQN